MSKFNVMSWSVLGLGLVLIAGLTSESTAESQAASDPAVELAERYGLKAWDDVERIDFTFKVALPDGRVIERPWSWSPPEGLVTADFGTDQERTFSLDAIDETNRDDHAKFINDSYWLLFPFQLVWSDCTVTDDGNATMPISGEAGEKLTVTYPDDGGYTPGDMYELFLDPDTGLIAEWNFRKGGSDIGRPATWDGYVGLNGLMISRVHEGPSGSGFTLTFPKVAVYAHGSVAAGTPMD
ncbi:MAG: hypothetical protein AAF328_08630 [Planctomycetota bacterium]